MKGRQALVKKKRLIIFSDSVQKADHRGIRIMASSFLDLERNDADNAQFLTNENDMTEKNLNTPRGHIALNVNAEELTGNVLLAAGDGNRNITKNMSGNTSQDFITNEVDKTSQMLNTSGKRKREQSPDTYEKEPIEGVEDSEGSCPESDEDNSEVVVASPQPSSAITKANSTEKISRNIDDELPDTVTLLKTPEGAKVYVVGTAHFSIESQEDVAKIIQAVQPHIVLVELCKARVNILQLDEKTILEEAKNINFEKIHSTIKQNGLIHGLMYILLLSMSAHITKQLGMAPGGEFRRAFAEAKQFPHCIVHLGDRPVHITLQRALSSIKEEVERCKRRDLLEEMLAEMTGEFPDLSTVFVKERDIYLTHSLQVAASIPVSCPTGVQPPRVVGVVGIGHVPGIVQRWGKVHQEDIPPLLYIPPPTLTSRIVRIGAKLSVVGLVLWGCSRILPISKVYPKLSELKTVVQNVFQIKFNY
ncbi:TraB domain-containing protein [Gryllus bimaculatus]|nr:TraB domain-containing protein [Gryllus bimaculatus]